MIGFGWDPTFILLIPGIIFAFYAQTKVQSTFAKFNQVHSRRGMTGAMVAQAILRNKGLDRVRVEHVEGHLSDHYDPRTKTVRLSSAVYHSTSLAALGVAAHETGHALQDDVGYLPLHIRHTIVPVAQFGSWAAWPLLFIGLMFRSGFFLQLGILFFTAAVVFQIVTLPVEFNASSRAMDLLAAGGFITREEESGAKQVLSAAAMTYVAAALMGILQLLRLLLLARAGGDDD